MALDRICPCGMLLPRSADEECMVHCPRCNRAHLLPSASQLGCSYIQRQDLRERAQRCVLTAALVLLGVATGVLLARVLREPQEQRTRDVVVCVMPAAAPNHSANTVEVARPALPSQDAVRIAPPPRSNGPLASSSPESPRNPFDSLVRSGFSPGGWQVPPFAIPTQAAQGDVKSDLASSPLPTSDAQPIPFLPVRGQQSRSRLESLKRSIDPNWHTKYPKRWPLVLGSLYTGCNTVTVQNKYPFTVRVALRSFDFGYDQGWDYFVAANSSRSLSVRNRLLRVYYQRAVDPDVAYKKPNFDGSSVITLGADDDDDISSEEVR